MTREVKRMLQQRSACPFSDLHSVGAGREFSGLFVHFRFKIVCRFEYPGFLKRGNHVGNTGVLSPANRVLLENLVVGDLILLITQTLIYASCFNAPY